MEILRLNSKDHCDKIESIINKIYEICGKVNKSYIDEEVVVRKLSMNAKK